MSAHSVSDQGGLASSYKTMGDAEAIDLAAKVYGVAGKVTRFATEKDDTFRLEAEDGRRFVLKVANPSEPSSEIDFQVQLMAHVAAWDASVPVPRVIPTLSGELHTQIEDGVGQRRTVRLMSYLEGTPLDSVQSTPLQREKVGEVLARLRHATAGFSHAADSRVLAWDVQHLMRLEPLLASVDDLKHRRMLAAGLERFSSLEPRIALLRRQVLHNDFSRSNIVVDGNNAKFVTGIIDFGDAVTTAVAIDVSTALLNQLPSDAATNPVADLFAAGRDLLRGYLRVAELTEEELRLIPHLTMARVVARALITLWRVKKFPENATYIMRNTGQGWAQLDWFLARTVDQVSETLLPMCAAGQAALSPSQTSRIEA